MKIGFVIWLGENEELGRAWRYAEIREMAQQAEEAEFDSILARLVEAMNLYRAEVKPW